MKIVKLFIRVFIVIFCFTMDVKVKADVTVEAVSGHVELQYHDQIFGQKEFSKLPLHLIDPLKAKDFDVQTLDGSVRFLMDDKKIGVQSGSIFSVDKNGVGQFSQGSIFFSISKSTPLKIQTPQSSIEAAGGDFFLEVGDGKTQVSVLSGSVTLIDRASKKSFDIAAGYTSWLGGLLATGQHAHPIQPQAIQLDRIMGLTRPLMGWTDKEFESRNKIITPLWKDAVLKVADDSQNTVDNDLKVLNSILENERNFEKKKSHEQARLRKLFREKTIGLPDRAPSSHFE